jgi:hypothetical protein
MRRVPKMVWVSLAVFALNYGVWYYINYRIWYDTYDWVIRAAVSSHAGDMAGYLDKGIDGMKRWGFTHGYAALIFKSPANDMSLINKSLERTKDRADLLSKEFLSGNPEKKITAVEYNQALDDLRSTLTEYPLQADYYWDVHFPGIIVSAIYYLSLFSLVVAIVRPLVRLEARA